MTVLPWHSSGPELHPGLRHLLPPQRTAKAGTVALADNKGPSEVFGHLIPKTGKMSHLTCSAGFSPTIWVHLMSSYCVLPAPRLSLRPCLLLFGGTVCVSVVRLLFTALQPTEYSHCLQPYGIVWQRTQTFLIESSRSVSYSSQFSGKTTWCFQNVVHQQAWVEFVPTCSLLGGTGLSFYDLRFISTLQRKQACAVLYWCENASHSQHYQKQLQSCRMASHLFWRH